MTNSSQVVAVVGGGISGMAAAWLLHRAGLQVQLFERAGTLGGHAVTVDTTSGSVDLGFQVFNLSTYAHTVEFFRTLNVDTTESDMSFSCSLRSSSDADEAFEWASHSLRTIFPHLHSWAEPQRYQLIRDVLRFSREAPGDADRFPEMLVQQYLYNKNYSTVFDEAYLQPMIAAIWSVPNATAMKMPLKSLLMFMENHHLLSVGWPPRPRWRVLTHRSRSYVNQVTKYLQQAHPVTGKRGQIHLNNAIIHLHARNASGVVLEDQYGDLHQFDLVVLAVHTDTALQILGPLATTEEKEVLQAICYQTNRCVLHHDRSMMPHDRRLWASWNSLVMSSASTSDPVTCTYWLNRLQNLPHDADDVFVTLNPPTTLQSLAEWTMKHPVLDSGAFRAQAKVPDLQGVLGVHFAGAWTRFGFHEDGMKSAVEVAASLGASVPWTTHSPSPVPPSLWSWLCFKMVSAFLTSAIRVGRLRLIMPNGADVYFGDASAADAVTMRIHSFEIFTSMASRGSIGLGEAFMSSAFDIDGDDAAALTDVFAMNFAEMNRFRFVLGPARAVYDQVAAWTHWYRQRNSIALSKSNVRAHYDIGNDMYETFLDESLMYSCAEFDRVKGGDLGEAQIRKMASILRQARIEKHHHVVEIGCGWGAMALFAVLQTGCRWTGITLSKHQKQHCDAKISKAGLQNHIRVLLLDYREYAAQAPACSIDRIVSIEMIEAVGHDNLATYFGCLQKLLVPGGLAVVQAITLPNSRYNTYRKSSDFIRHYIFPGGHLPCIQALDDAVESCGGLELEAKRSIGADYVETLRQWRQRFTANGLELSRLGYDLRFQRMFQWYFLFCESSFRHSLVDLHQLVYRRLPVLQPSGLSTVATNSLSSGIFTGHVYHHRKVGAKNSFRYPVVMAFVDLARIDSFAQHLHFLPKALVSFNRNDHFGDSSQPLQETVLDLVQKELGRRPKGNVYLLTTLRTLQYSFNPISIFYVMDDSNARVVAAVAEVTNTPWLERTCYVLDLHNEEGYPQQAHARKCLHVSPFFGMDYWYKFELNTMEKCIDFAVHLIEEEPKPSLKKEEKSHQAFANAFSARLELQRFDGDNSSKWRKLQVLLMLLFMPWMSQWWIHVHAASLVVQNQPIHKAHHPQYQGVRRICYLFDLIKHLFVFAIAVIGETLFKIVGMDVGNSTKL